MQRGQGRELSASEKDLIKGLRVVQPKNRGQTYLCRDVYIINKGPNGPSDWRLSSYAGQTVAVGVVWKVVVVVLV